MSAGFKTRAGTIAIKYVFLVWLHRHVGTWSTAYSTRRRDFDNEIQEKCERRHGRSLEEEECFHDLKVDGRIILTLKKYNVKI
jgi:hypothetical protein